MAVRTWRSIAARAPGWLSVVLALSAFGAYFAPWHRVHRSTLCLFPPCDEASSAAKRAEPESFICTGLDHDPHHFVLALLALLVVLAVVSAWRSSPWVLGMQVVATAGAFWALIEGVLLKHFLNDVDPLADTAFSILLLSGGLLACARILRALFLWARERFAKTASKEAAGTTTPGP